VAEDRAERGGHGRLAQRAGLLEPGDELVVAATGLQLSGWHTSKSGATVARVAAATAQQLFDDIARELAATMQVEKAMAFGKQGLRRAGKMCACLPDDDGMSFRLIGPAHARAMAAAGAHLWDPSGRDRPFKDWVYVPLADAASWPDLAKEAALALGS
jgi:hypothetical protein